MSKRYGLYTVTNLLIIINVIVYIYVSSNGDITSGQYLYECGGLMKDLPAGELYRLLTYSFLHSGFMHIASNMLLNFLIGNELEDYLGHVRLLLIYILSGLGAGFFALIYYTITNANIVMVGASGSSFGLLSALIIVGFYSKSRNKINGFYTIYVLYCLILGAFEKNVAIIGHFGGFICGLLITYLAIRFWNTPIYEQSSGAAKVMIQVPKPSNRYYANQFVDNSSNTVGAKAENMFRFYTKNINNSFQVIVEHPELLRYDMSMNVANSNNLNGYDIGGLMQYTLYGLIPGTTLFTVKEKLVNNDGYLEHSCFVTINADLSISIME